MESFGPENYNLLPLLAKVEVLEHVLQKTEGDDLKKVMILFYQALKRGTEQGWCLNFLLSKLVVLSS